MDRAAIASVRSVPQRRTAAAILLFCLSLALPLGAAKPSSSPASSGDSSVTSAPVLKAPERLEFADPYPSPPGPVPPDLQLQETRAIQAEALHLFTLGALAEERGETEQATAYFLKSLALDPAHVALATRVATELAARNETSEALRILKDAQKALPNHPSPPAEIARLYLEVLRQPDNALPFAEKAYKLAPDLQGVIAIYVEVCSAARLPQRIEDIQRKTLALAQTDARFWLSVGDVFRNAMPPRGPSASRPNLERLNSFFKKALDLAPRDIYCIEHSADHYALTGQIPEALALYARAHTLHRELRRSSSAPLVQKWARALLLGDRPGDAIEVLEDLLREMPLLASAQELAGEIYLRQGQLVSALGHFRLALEADPSAPEDHQRLIQIQLRLKRAHEAVQTASNAHKAFPDSPELTLLLAIALSEAKRPGDAIQSFALAEKQFASTQKEALNAEFYLTYGAAAERAGLLEKAAELLQKSIAMDPASAAEPLNYLGYMWVDRNLRLEEAGELIRKALELRPNHPAYLDSLGWWHYRKGNFQEAEALLRKALQGIKKDESAEVYDHLGEVLEKLQQPEKALAAWESALEMDPQLPGLAEKILRIRSRIPPPAPAP
ncbi:MAG: hypothetical protein RLZZ244_1084 [Verrucomicrobiota bacterium]